LHEEGEVLFFIVFMIISFLGYVLPWGQISFWGAAVISNFFRVIPYIGRGLVFWLWGEFLVGVFTLKLFLFGHFFLSLLSVVFIINHLVSLHLTGSSSKLLVSSMILKTVFFPKYIIKDYLVGLILIYLIVLNFYLLVEEENFLEIDLVASPLHIKPEWYFLFLYRVLRRVPSKLLGVGLRAIFIIIFLILGFGFGLNKWRVGKKVLVNLFFLGGWFWEV